MNRREFIGGLSAAALAARYGDDILASETARLASQEIHTDWPEGTGTEDYDFYSPLLLNKFTSLWGCQEKEP